MGRYAPGTDAHDEGQERRERHTIQRKQNVSDLMMGFGMIAQTLGAKRRADEQAASDDLYAKRIGQVMSGEQIGEPQVVGDPFSQPSMALPSDRGGESNVVSGGHMATPSFEQTIQQDMGSRQSGWQNLKNTFTGSSAPARLRPDQAMALFQAVEGKKRQGVEDRRYEGERDWKLDRAYIEDERHAEDMRQRASEGRLGRESNERIAGARAAAGNDPAADQEKSDIDLLKTGVSTAGKLSQASTNALLLANRVQYGSDDAIMELVSDSAMREFAQSDPSVSAAIQAATDAGLTAEQRQVARVSLAKSLRTIATSQGDRAKQFDPAYEALSRKISPAVERALGRPAAPNAIDSKAFGAKWLEAHGKNDAELAADPALRAALGKAWLEYKSAFEQQ